MTTMKPISPLAEGTAVLIRTVTHYYTGRVVSWDDHEIMLEDAAWVADTGRFTTALKSGSLSEIEPYPDGIVLVGRGAVSDISVWQHDLPRAQK